MSPTPLPARKPLFPSELPKQHGIRVILYLAFGLVAALTMLALLYQNHRYQEREQAAHPTPPKTVAEAGDQSVPAELRQWHMDGLDGRTEKQARQRFGKPVLTKDYNVTYGAFLGPRFGLKRYYLNNSAGFAEREKEAQVEWNFPQYSTVREIIWKLRESYITLWLGQPPREVDLRGDTVDASFAQVPAGEWIVLDNYRVGEDLVKNPPVAATPTATP